jgi:hypothetical protein
MNRRQFVRRSVGAASLAAIPTLANYVQPAIRTIYSNDTTHILSCQRPEARRAGFTDELLAASITEAAGVDAHFLQPGLGWMPWWKSKIYPAADHYAWLRDKHGIKTVQTVGRYLMDGGDMLTTLVDTCQRIGVAPFLSFRLNDGHHVRDLKEAIQRGKPSANMARHYWENYERFRIGPDLINWDEGVFDWSIAEVRDYKFALIEEACGNYDIAGLELDFLRHWVRFGPNTKADERFEITTAFVRRIRKMLDQTAAARGLPRRWLCVRVPANAAVRPQQGVDLAALVNSGANMINLSYSYFTWQDESVRRAREEVGESAAIYAEMTHTTMTGRATNGSGTQPFLRTTDEQFYTTAQLAYQQGAQGLSLFNFPYYRYHVTDMIGPFHEPPFHVLPKLKDRAFLDKQSQWAFLSSGRKDTILGDRLLPAILNKDQAQSFPLLMLPPARERADGLLRLRSDEAIADREIEVLFNGVKLAAVEPVRMPLPHPYADTWLGGLEELSCHALPASVPVLDKNEVSVTVKKGIRVRLIYLDVTLPH